MAEKILIVDDDEKMRSLIRLALKDEGYELHEAVDGASGLKAAREILPDLVVLDLMMPDKWGYAVCEELKGSPDTSGIIVLFLTARSSSPSKKMGEMKGGDDFMVKPFDHEELKKRVRELLDRK